MGQNAVPPVLSRAQLRLALGFALALGACKPGIGDPCTTSTDCSQTGDRLCDISQPYGYCTIYNCEPAGTNAAASCPDDSACVAFAVEPSPLAECANALGSTPYQRSFCLKRCDDNDDCRAQYVCIDPARSDVVNVDGAAKVCVVASSVGPRPAASSMPAGAGGDPSYVSAEVCTGSSNQPDAGSDVPTAGAGPDGEPSSGGGGAGGNAP